MFPTCRLIGFMGSTAAPTAVFTSRWRPAGSRRCLASSCIAMGRGTTATTRGSTTSRARTSPARCAISERWCPTSEWSRPWTVRSGRARARSGFGRPSTVSTVPARAARRRCVGCSHGQIAPARSPIRGSSESSNACSPARSCLSRRASSGCGRRTAPAGLDSTSRGRRRCWRSRRRVGDGTALRAASAQTRRGTCGSSVTVGRSSTRRGRRLSVLPSSCRCSSRSTSARLRALRRLA